MFSLISGSSSETFQHQHQQLEEINVQRRNNCHLGSYTVNKNNEDGNRKSNEKEIRSLSSILDSSDHHCQQIKRNSFVQFTDSVKLPKKRSTQQHPSFSSDTLKTSSLSGLQQYEEEIVQQERKQEYFLTRNYHKNHLNKYRRTKKDTSDSPKFFFNRKLSTGTLSSCASLGTEGMNSTHGQNGDSHYYPDVDYGDFPPSHYNNSKMSMPSGERGGDSSWFSLSRPINNVLAPEKKCSQNIHYSKSSMLTNQSKRYLSTKINTNNEIRSNCQHQQLHNTQLAQSITHPPMVSAPTPSMQRSVDRDRSMMNTLRPHALFHNSHQSNEEDMFFNLEEVHDVCKVAIPTMTDLAENISDSKMIIDKGNDRQSSSHYNANDLIDQQGQQNLALSTTNNTSLSAMHQLHMFQYNMKSSHTNNKEVRSNNLKNQVERRRNSTAGVMGDSYDDVVNMHNHYLIQHHETLIANSNDDEIAQTTPRDLQYLLNNNVSEYSHTLHDKKTKSVSSREFMMTSNMNCRSKRVSSSALLVNHNHISETTSTTNTKTTAATITEHSLSQRKFESAQKLIKTQMLNPSSSNTTTIQQPLPLPLIHDNVAVQPLLTDQSQIAINSALKRGISVVKLLQKNEEGREEQVDMSNDEMENLDICDNNSRLLLLSTSAPNEVKQTSKAVHTWKHTKSQRSLLVDDFYNGKECMDVNGDNNDHGNNGIIDRRSNHGNMNQTRNDSSNKSNTFLPSTVSPIYPPQLPTKRQLSHQQLQHRLWTSDQQGRQRAETQSSASLSSPANQRKSRLFGSIVVQSTLENAPPSMLAAQHYNTLHTITKETNPAAATVVSHQRHSAALLFDEAASLKTGGKTFAQTRQFKHRRRRSSVENHLPQQQVNDHVQNCEHLVDLLRGKLPPISSQEPQEANTEDDRRQNLALSMRFETPDTSSTMSTTEFMRVIDETNFLNKLQPPSHSSLPSRTIVTTAKSPSKCKQLVQQNHTLQQPINDWKQHNDFLRTDAKSVFEQWDDATSSSSNYNIQHVTSPSHNDNNHYFDLHIDGDEKRSVHTFAAAPAVKSVPQQLPPISKQKSSSIKNILTHKDKHDLRNHLMNNNSQCDNVPFIRSQDIPNNFDAIATQQQQHRQEHEEQKEIQKERVSKFHYEAIEIDDNKEDEKMKKNNKKSAVSPSPDHFPSLKQLKDRRDLRRLSPPHQELDPKLLSSSQAAMDVYVKNLRLAMSLAEEEQQQKLGSYLKGNNEQLDAKIRISMNNDDYSNATESQEIKSLSFQNILDTTSNKQERYLSALPLAFRQFALYSVKPTTIYHLITEDIDKFSLSCNTRNSNNRGGLGKHSNKHQPVMSLKLTTLLFPTIEIAAENAGALDLYPPAHRRQQQSDSSPLMDPAALAAFIFPRSSVRVQLIPKAALEYGAERLGLVGSNADKYSVLAFSDGAGVISYGVAITVREQLDEGIMSASITKQLLKISELNRASICITKYFKNIFRHRAQRNKRQHQYHGDTGNEPKRNQRQPLYSRVTLSIKKGSRRNIFSKKNPLKSLYRQIHGSGSSGPSSRREHPSISTPFDSQILPCILKRIQKADQSSFLTMHHALRPPILSRKTRILPPLSGCNNESFVPWYNTCARDAHERMKEHEKLGNICIVEKCYVMIGCRPEEEAVLFSALQMIVNSDRKSTTSSRQEASQRKANDPSASVVNNNKSTNRHSMLTTASNEMNVLHRSNSWIKKNGDSILWRDEMLSINSINNLSSNDINDKLLIKCLDSKCESNQPDSNKRHIILKVIQTKARLSAKQKKVEHPHYELSHVIGKNQAHQQHQFELSLPIKNSSPLVLPLPIPQVSGEWGFTKLMLGLGAEKLVMILKLMLLERSVLVLGQSCEEVTSCSRALIELLLPYEWPFSFLPLLPRDMIDFINSPVPFVVGMVCDGIAEINKINSDHRVNEAIKEGLTVLNTSAWSLRIPNEDGIMSLISTPPHLRSILESLRQRLDYLFCRESLSSHNICSFKRFMKYGFGRREKMTISSARKLIFSYMMNLAGDVANHQGSWKRYGNYDDSTGFNFYPSLLIDQFRVEFSFREALVNSHIFTGFVDSMRNHDIGMNKTGTNEVVNRCREKAGQTIADWVCKNWPEWRQHKRDI